MRVERKDGLPYIAPDRTVDEIDCMLNNLEQRIGQACSATVMLEGTVRPWAEEIGFYLPPAERGLELEA